MRWMNYKADASEFETEELPVDGALALLDGDVDHEDVPTTDNSGVFWPWAEQASPAVVFDARDPDEDEDEGEDEDEFFDDEDEDEDDLDDDLEDDDFEDEDLEEEEDEEDEEDDF